VRDFSVPSEGHNFYSEADDSLMTTLNDLISVY